MDYLKKSVVQFLSIHSGTIERDASLPVMATSLLQSHFAANDPCSVETSLLIEKE
jgi:hypothetical protein